MVRDWSRVRTCECFMLYVVTVVRNMLLEGIDVFMFVCVCANL